MHRFTCRRRRCCWRLDSALCYSIRLLLLCCSRSFILALSIDGIRRYRAPAVWQARSATTAAAQFEASDLNLQYSCLFHRHVVLAKDGAVVESFQFLDEASEAYPNVSMVPLNECVLPLAGGGLEESTAYHVGSVSDTVNLYDDALVDSILNATMLDENLAKHVKNKLPPNRWAGLTPERVRSNYQEFDRLLESKLQLKSSAMAVTNIFPPVLLYESRLVEERLGFLLAPLPPLHERTSDADWPLLASQGYGAGWTIEQIRMALQSVPHVVLAMHFEDASSMRPSLLYFLTVLQVSYKDVDEVPLKLDQWGDVYTFAYLYGAIGLDWSQLSIMLDAFPCLAVCDNEPTWEMIGKTRKILKEDVLHYLQRRLQVGPTTVEAMLKTHPFLCYYSVQARIQPTLDALQSKIGLSSRDLQKCIIRMPSLMGMSVEESSGRGLSSRLEFFRQEVGMTQTELRTAVMKQPSLLQYSVDNSLRPKLDFFVKELSISKTDMPRLINISPSFMGRSLKETLRPTVKVLREQGGLSTKEVGAAVSRAPEILQLSLKGNIEPTLEYLSNRLGLTRPQLRKLVTSTPRVLLHSISSSLEPKLRLIESALGDDEGSKKEAVRVVSENPALLVSSIASLQRRVQSGLARKATVKEVLRPRSKGLKRRKKPVLEIDPVTDAVTREHYCVSAAASALGTSLPNVYNICRTGRVWKGRRLVYGDLPSVAEAVYDVSFPVHSTLETKAPRNQKEPSMVFRDLRSALMASGDSPIQQSSQTNATLWIEAFVSGRVHPPSTSTDVRGISRGGGMVMYFPQFDRRGGCPELADRLLHAATKSFEQIMPFGKEGHGTLYDEGRILVGFPYLRRSRNRCELYACHNALKVVGQLLKQEARLLSLEKEHIQVDIYTDSDYAWKLLHNGTRLHTWGSVLEEKDFCYDGHGPASLANPDLLHPLCRTYFRLVQQQDVDGTPLKLGEQVNVTFHHAAGSIKSLHGYARQAAMWMHERSKTPFQVAGTA